MAKQRLLQILETWIELQVGIPLSLLSTEPVPVFVAKEKLSQGGFSPTYVDSGIAAVKVDELAGVVVKSELVEVLKPIVAGLHPDLLFSHLGCYELSKVTLPNGFGVFGPSWLLFADKSMVVSITDNRPVEVLESELLDVDRGIFWHTHINDSLARFAVFEGDRLVALSTVIDRGEPVCEIGMDVLPDAKGRGLGRAVVAAAAEWILQNNRIAMASVGPFNVPSARTLRSVGLRYLMSISNGIKGGFRVHPQSLGRPYPNAKMYDYYPRWAMNQDILPKDAASELN